MYGPPETSERKTRYATAAGSPLAQETVALWASAAVPLPERAIVSVGFDALLAITNEPLSCPTPCGANPTARTRDWPGDNVEGSIGGATVNPAPDTSAELTVIGAPDTDRVTFCAADEPTSAEPKFTVVLLAAIVPADAAIPLPERVTVSVEFDALLAIISEPLACPAVCGAN